MHIIRHIGTMHQSILVEGAKDTKEGTWDKVPKEERDKIKKLILDRETDFIHGMFIGTIIGTYLVSIYEIIF